MKKLTILISFSGDGGVEKMMINLLRGLISQGVDIDLLVIKDRPPYFARVPEAVNVIKLGPGSAALCKKPLVNYLKTHQPEVLLAAKHRALKLAIQAKQASEVNTRIVGQIHSHTSESLKHKLWIKRVIWLASMRKLYPRADSIISVSQGVADDIQRITRMDPHKLAVIYNPVVSDELTSLANQPVDHPWLNQPDGTAVIVAAGRFYLQKDFITLIKAFSLLSNQRPCRLIILGKGKLLGAYQALSKKLGISDDISFPGFIQNPYSYMARAQLFVLSSAWEGFGLVLAEAMAVGTPVVSTNCKSGPSEILMDNQFGKLTTVGDAQALATAMAETLDNPQSKSLLQQACERFTIAHCTKQYIEQLHL
jgi:glycosyltransferase involved in cell wall biosynthesis